MPPRRSSIFESNDDISAHPFKKPYVPDANYIPYETDPPETLPSGSDACPVRGCPAFGREFKPYWRINEHMKMKHGWSRKNLQKGNDRRLKGNQVTNRRRRRHRDADDDVDDNDADSPYEKKHRGSLSTTNPDSSVASPTFSSPLSSLGSVSPTASLENVNDKVGNLLETASTKSPGLSMSPPLKLAPRLRATKNTRDEEMVARIKQHIAELEIPGNHRDEDPKATEARQKMVQGLKSILEKDLIHVNTVMPASQCQAITPLYKTLAARDRLQASTFRSTPAVPSPPILTAAIPPPSRRESAPLPVPVSQEKLGRASFRVSPMNPNRRSMSAFTSPNADARPMKLTLKLGPRTGLQAK